MPPPNVGNTGHGMASLDTATLATSLDVRLWRADKTRTTVSEALARTRQGRVLVVLVRHFYCINCQAYVRQMAKLLPDEKLAVANEGYSAPAVIVIGCGSPSLIDWYVRVTECPYPVYADPDTQLYKALGTHRTGIFRGRMRRLSSSSSPPPSYVQYPLSVNYLRTFLQGIKMIAAGNLRKSGNLMMNGGEFLFLRGADCDVDGGRQSSGRRVNIGLLGQQRPPPKRQLRRRANANVPVNGPERQQHMGEEERESEAWSEEDDDEDDQEDEEYDLWGERKSRDHQHDAVGLNAERGDNDLSSAAAEGAQQQQQQQRGNDWKIQWFHRMRNSRDHTDVDDLKKMMALTGNSKIGNGNGNE